MSLFIENSLWVFMFLTVILGGGAAFQVIELVPGALPVGAGLIRYAQEFAAFG